MAIELSNGAIVPDIPNEILSQYPYVIIANFIDISTE